MRHAKTVISLGTERVSLSRSLPRDDVSSRQGHPPTRLRENSNTNNTATVSATTHHQALLLLPKVLVAANVDREEERDLQRERKGEVIIIGRQRRLGVSQSAEATHHDGFPGQTRTVALVMKTPENRAELMTAESPIVSVTRERMKAFEEGG
uniref:Uncharacterized protein n=1 Tax=Chromera velia CCMP2878 TaxID=1169474 RepID=A0A0G4H9F3_9ALVE|eukprot:Cvel_5987.t1-p1 / transcript=Cvel_5987.t1 / gene=Cvel_5987 / organism=Chromera_velia_CCMP2878 / gene_product=hypothetical protein / transcript_product=hypothetical protein / location=Cvel_scaffold286:102188-102640(-) / protein_length=151 / sequence_SO=supercontig / SO=protein_coding / is_pseudo=false